MHKATNTSAATRGRLHSQVRSIASVHAVKKEAGKSELKASHVV